MSTVVIWDENDSCHTPHKSPAADERTGLEECPVAAARQHWAEGEIARV